MCRGIYIYIYMCVCVRREREREGGHSIKKVTIFVKGKTSLVSEIFFSTHVNIALFGIHL